MSAPKSHDRQTAILKAAGELFLAKGLDGTTTLDIASAAGVSKRDLYAAFATKDAILTALIIARVEQFAAPVQFAQPRNRTETLATLEHFARGFLVVLLSDDVTGLYRLAITTAERQPAAGRALLTFGIEGTIERVTGFVASAAEQGCLTLDREAVAPAVAAYLTRAIGRLQMQRLLDPAHVVGDAAIDEHARAAVAVLTQFETNASRSKLNRSR